MHATQTSRALLLSFAVLAFLAVNFSARARPAFGHGEEERYYRAVYVLRRLSPAAAAEPEDIPAGIRYQDASESLLHHPDRIFVLRHVAGELAALGGTRPKAVLYEAYARLALGQKEAAVPLLSRYVVENPYAAGHYALLCDTLYMIEDYIGLLLICREWRERDPACNAERAEKTFAALYNLERRREAGAFARAEDCLGWRGEVYDAKCLLAEGDEEGARRALEAAVQRRPEDAPHIRRLWELVRDRLRM